MADQEGRFEGVEEVAERLLVDPQTVRRWIKSGKLKAYKPGREYRILSNDLDAFLESRSSPKAPALHPSVEESPEGRRAIELVRSRLSDLDRISERLEAVAAARTFDAVEFRKADDGLGDVVSSLFGSLRDLRDQGVAIGPGTSIDNEVDASMTRLVIAQQASIEAARAMLRVDELAQRRKQNAQTRAWRNEMTEQAAENGA
jgi:excisionase family DNA binding protein